MTDLDHPRTLSCGHTYTLRQTACPTCFAQLRDELAAWKKGVEDANRISQRLQAERDAAVARAEAAEARVAELEAQLAAPMVICPDCQIPVAVTAYPQHFRDHRAPATAPAPAPEVSR